MVVRIDGDDRVAIFVDGRRMNMNKGIMSGRASYDLDLLPSIMNVERIDILHGAVGSTYLNYDTPAGAINIVTKKGDKRETTVDLAAGEHGSWKVKAITSGSLDDWSWVATGGFDNVDYMKYKGTDDHTHEMPNSDNNRREMAYRIDKKLTDNTSLTFDYGHLSNDTGTWISKSYPQDYNYEKLINHFALTYNYKENTETPAFLAIYHYYTQGDSYIPTGFINQEDEKLIVAGKTLLKVLIGMMLGKSAKTILFLRDLLIAKMKLIISTMITIIFSVAIIINLWIIFPFIYKALAVLIN